MSKQAKKGNYPIVNVGDDVGVAVVGVPVGTEVGDAVGNELHVPVLD